MRRFVTSALLASFWFAGCRCGGRPEATTPGRTLWSDHPVAILEGAWVSDAAKKAARTYVSFLRGRPVQEQALAFGFRSADPSVPLKTADARNPFTRLAQYGIQIDIPPAAATPSGPVVRNLLTMWSRVVGNR